MKRPTYRSEFCYAGYAPAEKRSLGLQIFGYACFGLAAIIVLPIALLVLGYVLMFGGAVALAILG